MQLHALDYNLANFMRTPALSNEVQHWSLTTLWGKLVKIGAERISHGRFVTFQLAAVVVPRNYFQKILGLIDDLRRFFMAFPAWADDQNHALGCLQRG